MMSSVVGVLFDSFTGTNPACRSVARRRHGIKVPEVVIEGAIEVQDSFFVEVAMNLLLVAVKDRDQKIRRSRNGLPAAIKDPYLQPACG
jgi:hypothetical protein